MLLADVALAQLAEFGVGLLAAATPECTELLLTLGGSSRTACSHVLTQLLQNSSKSNPINDFDAHLLRCLGRLALSSTEYFLELDGFKHVLIQVHYPNTIPPANHMCTGAPTASAIDYNTA